MFGMMIILDIFKSSGVFEFFAVRVYNNIKGNKWILMGILSFLCFFMAVFLDDVTLILILAPITFEICKVMNVDPKPFLIMECLFGSIFLSKKDIGGSGTPLSEEFIIVMSNIDMKMFHLSFVKSFFVLCPGAFLAFLSYVLIVRANYHNVFPETPYQIIESKSEDTESKSEDIESKSEDEKSINVEKPSQNEQVYLDEFCKNYKIQNLPLFIKSSIVLCMVISLSIILPYLDPYVNLTLAWISLIGAVAILIFSGVDEMEGVLERSIDWSMMTYFASMFVIIECVTRMGMIALFGGLIQEMVINVPLVIRDVFSISIVLWGAALGSSIIDNVAFITAMLPIVIQLASPPTCIKIDGVLYALFYGTMIGGCGTIVGCISNVIVSEMAHKRGCHISFWTFFKLSAPFTVICLFVVWIYLIVLHVIFGI